MISKVRDFMYFKKLMLLSFVLILILAGCSSSTSSKPAETNNGSATKPIEWKLFTINNENYHLVKTYRWWSQEVEKQTNGRLKITVYPGGSLSYKQGEALDVLEKGLVDVSEVWGGAIGGAVKSLEVVDLPGLIPSNQALRLKLQDELMGSLNTIMTNKKHNAQIYAMLQLDPRNIYSTSKLSNYDSVKGKKIRAQASLETNFTNFIGAIGTPLAFNDVYLAMQQKVVDGYWLIDSATYDNKMYEVAKYIIDLQIGGASVFLMINKESFNKLPSDIQQILKNLEPEYKKQAVKNFKESMEVSRKALVDKGMEVITWSEEDKKRVNVGAAKLWEDWYSKADADAQKTFNQAKQFIEKNSQ